MKSKKYCGNCENFVSLGSNVFCTKDSSDRYIDFFDKACRFYKEYINDDVIWSCIKSGYEREKNNEE